MITGKNYIGNTKTANGNKTFKTFNPQKNTENEWTFTEATSADVNKACELAANAFKTYSKVSGAKKAKFLRAIAIEIENLGEELLNVYCLESGLPAGRAANQIVSHCQK